MSAGVYPAGTEPAGADPIVVGITTRVKRPTAVRYEGSLRDWKIYDSTGGYQAVTPVEQGFVLGLCVQQGQITSSPLTGHTLHEIETLDGTTIDADVNDRVRRANPIARYLSEGQAAIKRVVVDISARQLRVAVYFVDLTRDKNRILRRDVALT